MKSLMKFLKKQGGKVGDFYDETAILGKLTNLPVKGATFISPIEAALIKINRPVAQDIAKKRIMHTGAGAAGAAGLGAGAYAMQGDDSKLEELLKYLGG